MTRAAFVEGFVSRLRGVIQKHDRVNSAVGPCAYQHAQRNLDAVAVELADYVFDAIEAHTLSLTERH